MSEVSERLAEVEAGVWNILNNLMADNPMWIGDDGEPLDYLPEREGRICAFIEDATKAIAVGVEQMLAEARAEERERAKFNDDVRREQIRAARAEALREAADAVRGAVSYGFELRPDGSEDPTAAVYVEGLRDAWQIVKGRADAAEREAR